MSFEDFFHATTYRVSCTHCGWSEIRHTYTAAVAATHQHEQDCPEAATEIRPEGTP